MKVWMLKEDPSSGMYACRPDSTEPDYGEICACRWHTPTPTNWRNYDWYILNSKEQAEWYKEGIEERMKEARLKDNPDFIPHVQVVEVDITFNGFSDVDFPAKDVADRPVEPKPEHPPISERLNKRQEEDLKKWLDKALYMLTDLSFVANMHGEAGIDSLATSIQNYMIAMKHVMFPEPEEDGI